MAAAFPPNEVFNQSPPFEDVNLYRSDRALAEALMREGGGGEEHNVHQFGEFAGSRQALELGRLANEFPPLLKTHDSKGRRLDIVEFHPAYHALMGASCAAGLHRLGNGGGAHVVRSALLYLAAQMEAGHCCPMTMTNAARPVLLRQPDVAAPWLEKTEALAYDPRHLPASAKTSVTLGMGMTEKQGGTDVRANTSLAVPLGGSGAGRGYAITGHKWFMSAPMSDAFLVLAQAAGGLTCFLLPRFRSDGTVNAIRLQRLKAKLGNRSNASCEVEFDAAHAYAIGEEGQGIRVIIEMVTETRLDCAVSSAGLMRAALAEAIHHTQYRTVFQKRLMDQPVMRMVLADMALDVEAAVALSFRLARAFDNSADPLDRAWRRIMTPVAKYWVCKSAPALVAEAMECLGGNGYVEESRLPRLYREVPVNAIWEGSGNVMALDLIRVCERDPDGVGVLLEDLAAGAARDPGLKDAHARVAALLRDTGERETHAREIAAGLAQLAAGVILTASHPACVADGFIATRFGKAPRFVYGAAIAPVAAREIVQRAAPAIAG